MSIINRFRILGTFVLFFSISYLAMSQTQYDDVEADDKKIIFRDDFNDNSNNWEGFKAGEYFSKISDGTLNITNLASPNLVSLNQDLDVSFWEGDWQIEMRLKVLDSKEDPFYFSWNYKSGGREDIYLFGLSQDGSYELSEFMQRFYETIVEGTTEHINTDGFNTLTIRKVGLNYYYFVNQQLIHAQMGQSVSRPQIAFRIWAKISAQVDYLEVANLKNKTSYTDGKYFALLTKGTGYSGQYRMLTSVDDLDWLKRRADESLKKTTSAYDKIHNRWILIEHQNTGITEQKLYSSDYDWTVPDEVIQGFFDEGYTISDLTYSNDEVFVVGSKKSRYTESALVKTPSVYQLLESDRWKELDRKVTKIAYAPGVWTVLGHQNTGITDQQFLLTEEFPEDKINEYTGQGYSISQIDYFDYQWMVLFSKYEEPRHQALVINNSYNSHTIDDLGKLDYVLTGSNYIKPDLGDKLTGTWHSEADDTYIEFRPGFKVTVKMGDSTYGEGRQSHTIDGKTYDQYGSYKWTSSSSPDRLEIKMLTIISDNNVSDGTLFKGIIRFIDDNTLEYLIAKDSNEGDFPKQFTNGDDPLLFKLKRVK